MPQSADSALLQQISKELMSEQSLIDEVAAENDIEDALEYLRLLPQFQVVLKYVFEARKSEVGLGMANASQDNALRLCGQFCEVENFLSILRG